MSIFKRIDELQRENRVPFALCTVVGSKGSSPRKSGRMIVFPDKSIEGTIGGGPVEWRAINEAVDLISLGESKLLEVILDKSQPNGLPMTCGGQMLIHIETFMTRPKLFLIGAGHVNRALLALAKQMDWEPVIVDDRPVSSDTQWSSEDCRVFIDEDIEAACLLARPHINVHDFVVIATKDNDELALKALMEVDCHYIGLIGSQRKCHLIVKNLGNDVERRLWLERVHMPIGLEIGAHTPEEIAISIMGELLAVRNGKRPKHLSQDKPLVFIRGAGDLATGVAVRLFKSGYSVVMSEIKRPTCIRHEVAFASAVFKGEHIVEGVRAVHCQDLISVLNCLSAGQIAVFTGDEQLLHRLSPQVFVEATIRKVAEEIEIDIAPLTLGLGPGFIAGTHVHGVIETNRGHYLGSVIWEGSAEADTKTPGNIGGFTHERVIKTPRAGTFIPSAKIGQVLQAGDTVGYLVDGHESQSPIKTTIAGVLRGILFEPMSVSAGFKVADVDPRAKYEHCFSISDKSRAIAGGVLEAICEKYPK